MSEKLELKEFADLFSERINAKELGFSEAIMDLLFSEERNKVFDEYIEQTGTLEIDYLNKIHQFFYSDRDEKKQDFTAETIANLIAKTSEHDNECWVYDCCAGSGSLTIQKWISNKSLKFYCEELDEQVIPLLLFNLSIRNIEAYVVRKNILSGEVYETYQLTPTGAYSNIEIVDKVPELEITTAISNPPYNIPIGKDNNSLIGNCPIAPPNTNANFLFVLKCLEKSDKCSLILPNGVLSTKGQESWIRKWIVDEGLLESVITLPQKIFPSTPVSTSILTLTKKKNKKVVMIDHSKTYDAEERKQRGEDHARARVYTKKINVLSDEHIKNIMDCIASDVDVLGMSAIVKNEDIKDCDWQVSKYVDFVYEEEQHRPIETIVEEINAIRTDKNELKLTVNEKWAKQVGLYDVGQDAKQGNELTKEINQFIGQLCGKELIKENYITLSKSKVFTFSNESKETLSLIIQQVAQLYVHHIKYLNDKENVLLAEMREALLPVLMTGQVDVTDF